MFFTSPIATHAVAQVAYKSGVVPVGRNLARNAGAKTTKTSAAKSKARQKTGKRNQQAGARHDQCNDRHVSAWFVGIYRGDDSAHW